MKSRIYALAVALAMLLTALPASGSDISEGQKEDWTQVQSLAIGTDLIVETKSDDTVKGKFNSATDSELKLSRDGKVFNLDRSNIKRVYLSKGKSRKKAAIQGACITGAAALGIGTGVVLSNRSSGDPNLAPVSFGFIGAAIGAAIGAIAGGKRKGALVYEAK